MRAGTIGFVYGTGAIGVRMSNLHLPAGGLRSVRQAQGVLILYQPPGHTVLVSTRGCKKLGGHWRIVWLLGC